MAIHDQGRLRLLPVLLLQALGSASTAMCTIVLAKTIGAAGQGIFSSLKAEIDLLAGAGMLGLPQAMIYYLERRRLSRARIRRITLWQASLVIALTSAVLVAMPLDPAIRHGGMPPAILAAVAVGALVAHGNARALGLVDRSPSMFAFVTVLPSLAIMAALGCALLAVPLSWQTSIHVQVGTFALAYALAAVSSWTLAASHPVRAEAVQEEEPLRSLLIYGSTTFVLGIAQTAAVVGTLQWIGRALLDKPGVGIFSAGIMVATTVLLPVSYLGPLILKSWIAKPGIERWRQLHRWMAALTALIALVTAIFAAGHAPIVSTVFGSEYLTRGAVLPILVVSACPLAARNLLHIYVFAVGRPWLAMPGEATRQLVLAVGVVSSHGIMRIAVVWAIAETAGAIVTWTVAWRLQRQAARS